MAVQITNPLTDELADKAVAELSGELKYLYETAGVPLMIMAKLSSLGITTADILAKVVSSEAELRSFMKDDVGMDPSASAGNRVAMAKLCNAWESSCLRGKKRKEEDAEQRVSDLPRRLPRNEHAELRKTFTKRHRETEDRHTPHPEYIERKLQQLEDGDLKAERLTEVVSLADDDGGDQRGLGFETQTDGTVKFKKTNAKTGTVPQNSEEFRTKTKLIAHLWGYIRLKVGARAYLDGYEFILWEDYADYILGDKVAAISVAHPTLKMSCRPTWQLVLSYEFEFRKQLAWAFNNRSGTLADHMEWVKKETDVYQLHFLTPLSLQAGEAAAQAGSGSQTVASAAAAEVHSGPPAVPAGRRARAARAKAAADQGTPTDISKQFCFAFQNNSVCKNPQCPRLHRCSQCNGKNHGYARCPNKPKDRSKGRWGVSQGLVLTRDPNAPRRRRGAARRGGFCWSSWSSSGSSSSWRTSSSLAQLGKDSTSGKHRRQDPLRYGCVDLLSWPRPAIPVRLAHGRGHRPAAGDQECFGRRSVWLRFFGSPCSSAATRFFQAYGVQSRSAGT